MNKQKLMQQLQRLMSKLKRKGLHHSQSSKESTEQTICGDPAAMKTANASNASVTIRLAELSLLDFIKCYCYEDYSPVGEASVAWKRILSEYYVAKEDAHASRYLELVMIIERLRYRSALLNFMAETITTLYTDKLAGVFRSLFPSLKFTYESHMQDLEAIERLEKPNMLEFDQAKRELDEMERSNGPAKATTPQDKERAIFKSVIGINSALQSTYNVDTLNALTYALLLRQVELLIEKRQNNNN